MADWELFEIGELSDLLQIDRQTVRNSVNTGRLEYVQPGGAKHIPRGAAVALVSETGWAMPGLLPVAQVVALLRLSPQTIRNWIAVACPAIHAGRSARPTPAIGDDPGIAEAIVRPARSER